MNRDHGFYMIYDYDDEEEKEIDRPDDEEEDEDPPICWKCLDRGCNKCLMTGY